MILSIRQTKQFKKDIKAARRQKKDITELDKIVSLLQCGEPLPEKYKYRALTGDLKYNRE